MNANVANQNNDTQTSANPAHPSTGHDQPLAAGSQVKTGADSPPNPKASRAAAPARPKATGKPGVPPVRRPDTQPTLLPLSAITVDPALQVRELLQPETAASYAEDMAAGDQFPPAVVYKVDKEKHLLADGLHRYEAAKLLNRKMLLVEIRVGSREDALRYALSANATHGLPRTNADKHRAVKLALAAFAALSDRSIADLCKVSPTLVAGVRRQAWVRNECRH